MKVSEHAYERGKERLGLNRGAFVKLADRALRRGVKYTDLKGRLRKYINEIYNSSGKKGRNIRLFGEHVYVFQGDFLVTVFTMPHEYKNYKTYIKGSNQVST